MFDLQIITTLLCWSAWGILDKKALEHTSEAGVLIRLYSLNLLILPPLWWYLASVQSNTLINHHVWLWTGCAAGVQLIALASYLVAMTITDASLVLGITAAYPVVSQLLAVFMLREEIQTSRITGSIAVAIGVIGIGATLNKTKQTISKRDKVILSGAILAALVGWGIWAILDKKATQYGSALEVLFAESAWECAFALILCLVAVTFKHPIELRNKHAWRWSCASAASLGLGRLTFLSALSAASASYVIAITGCYPLIMYFLAVFFLKERFNKLRLLSISLIVAGGVLVQLSKH